MTYHLYIANKNYSSWSLRAWLLMRAHNIPFEEHLMPYEAQPAGRQLQWKSFSPTAHVPCLHHFPSPSSSEPIIVWESLAIAEHLAECHPSLPIWPPSLPARAWARSAAAEMHGGFAAIRDEMSMSVGARVALDDPPSAALVADLRRLDELWAEGLARFGGPFLAGPDLGAVDAFYAPVAARIRTFVGSEAYLGERSRAYVERILGVEAVREWVRDALAERWREKVHEEDAVRGRRVVEDLRAGGEVVWVGYEGR